jgi:hypothetical protein
LIAIVVEWIADECDWRLAVLTQSELLSGDSVLPGFSFRLADLFGELDRHR